MRYTWLGFVAVMLASCTAEIPNGVIACDFDNACPTGFVCRREAAGGDRFCFNTGASDLDAGEAGCGGTGGMSGSGGTGATSGSGGTSGTGMDSGVEDASFDASDSSADAEMDASDAGVDASDAGVDASDAGVDASDADVDAYVPPTCATTVCDANAVCDDSSGLPICTCNAPYWEDDGQGGCRDVHECNIGNGGCASGVTCTERVGGPPSCGCPDGFSGSAPNCLDINECANNTDNCDSDERCQNTTGAFTCTACTAIANCASGLTCTTNSNQVCGTCAPGYIGDGTNTCTPCGSGTYDNNNACVDCGEIDNCAVNETCNPTNGSNLVCATCSAGFRGNGTNTCTACTAIANCASGLTCTTNSNQVCGTCAPGYVGDGTNTCTPCGSGTYDNSNACVDCGEIDNCAVNETCNPTNGSNLVCPSCDPGYFGDGMSTCVEVCESAICTDDYPCRQHQATAEYNCRGLFADWTPSTSPSTFMVSGSGIVTDMRSGLVWQRAVDTGTYSRASAATYCATLPLAGGGWRLPTVAELESLVDYSRSNPTIDTAYFPSTPTTFFWTSSPYATVAYDGWIVNFSHGGTGTAADDTVPYRVRCVR